MKIEGKAFLVLVFLGCLACASVRPPPGDHSLTGYVLDQAGNPLSGVTVEVRQRWWQAARQTYTSEAGEFRLTGLPPGRYRVKASARGLKPVVHVDVPVPTTGGREIQLIMEVRYKLESGRAFEAGAGPSPLPSPASGGRGQTSAGDSGVACPSGEVSCARPTPVRSLRLAGGPAGCGGGRSTR